MIDVTTASAFIFGFMLGVIGFVLLTVVVLEVTKQVKDKLGRPDYRQPKLVIVKSKKGN